IHADAHFHNEARIYSLFPEHLSQEWAGFGQIPPLHLRVPFRPVVPKFFGLYAPESEIAQLDPPSRAEPSSVSGSDSGSKSGSESGPGDRPTLIMLMEDCGTPIEQGSLKINWSHLLRLHIAGFAQGSFHERNILVQPGPLCLPPDKRTMESPSFRIIDFGRGRARRDYADEDGFFQQKHQDQVSAVASLGIDSSDLASSMRIGGSEGIIPDEMECPPVD
ncbi:hypothetical protein BOTBODRAFT_115979, partial [Botryobasidium botryosum FD-172 SS1]